MAANPAGGTGATAGDAAAAGPVPAAYGPTGRAAGEATRVAGGGTGAADDGATAAGATGAGEAAAGAGEAGAGAGDGGAGGFTVRLDNFTGPFDLLLQLIHRRKLDVTEVALHQVTDEFLAYLHAMGDAWDLDEASEFLVVAATLLDLKAARLLPAAEVEDEEDLALLEARDLLFARLLQYQAFKQAAAHLRERYDAGSRRYGRAVRLEERYAKALPELVLAVGAERLAELAAAALRPRPEPRIPTAHIHQVRVSVREHAVLLRQRLLAQKVATFRALCRDCRSTLEVVARFLALLELYREGMVAFEQVEALGELSVRWTGGDQPVKLEIDEYAGAPEDAGAAREGGEDRS